MYIILHGFGCGTVTKTVTKNSWENGYPSGGFMALTQSEKDRKRLSKLKEGGGKNVLLRLRREETAALDLLARYHGLNKGEMVARLILDEHRRLASLVMSDPEARDRFIKTPPSGSIR